MLVNKAVQLTMLAAATMLWEARTDAAPSAFKVCGRTLSEFMSRVCHVYNSPSWDAPTVVEQPATAVRRRRDTGAGISDCCTYGCTWEQLSEYCSEVSINSDTLVLDVNAPHDIKRSAEQESSVKGVKVDAAAPLTLGDEKLPAKRKGDAGSGTRATGARREVGGTRSGGYGRARRGRRCGCRRRRRSGRRRASLMGNMVMVESVTRGPPSIGTVSPLLTWGRTLNTDLPQSDRDRYAYVAVYST